MKNQIIFALTLLCANFFDTECMSRIKPRRVALLVVDAQGAFHLQSTHYLHNGSLAVPGTNQAHQDGIIATAKLAKEKGLFVAGTRDLHPNDHCSFMTSYKDANGNIVKVAPGTLIQDVPNGPIRHINGYPILNKRQELWYKHGVIGDEAEGIPDGLRCYLDAIFNKGGNPTVDCYSGFKDAQGHSTGLGERLVLEGVTDVIVIGDAADFCVPASYGHSAEYGFNTHVLLNDSCSINEDNAIKKMKAVVQNFGQKIKIYAAEDEKLSGEKRNFAEKVKRAGINVTKHGSKNEFIDSVIAQSEKRNHELVLDGIISKLDPSQLRTIKEESENRKLLLSQNLSHVYGLLARKAVASAA